MQNKFWHHHLCQCWKKQIACSIPERSQYSLPIYIFLPRAYLHNLQECHQWAKKLNRLQYFSNKTLVQHVIFASQKEDVIYSSATDLDSAAASISSLFPGWPSLTLAAELLTCLTKVTLWCNDLQWNPQYFPPTGMQDNCSINLPWNTKITDENLKCQRQNNICLSFTSTPFPLVSLALVHYRKAKNFSCLLALQR